MKFQAIVFKPGQEGEAVTIDTSDFSTIVDGGYESTYNKHGFPNTVVIVNNEGLFLELPRNRGYHGTFIVAKEHEDEEIEGYVSFTNDEVVEIKEKLDNKKNFVSKNKFLETFFEEKDVPVTTFYYERGFMPITLSNYDVIESILASEDTEFLKKVELTLRKIDFVNGDINHFLQHMGNGMADQIAESQKDFFNF